MTCACGHEQDEHDGPVCDVEGCDCAQFEWDGESDA